MYTVIDGDFSLRFLKKKITCTSNTEKKRDFQQFY